MFHITILDFFKLYLVTHQDSGERILIRPGNNIVLPYNDSCCVEFTPDDLSTTKPTIYTTVIGLLLELIHFNCKYNRNPNIFEVDEWSYCFPICFKNYTPVNYNNVEGKIVKYDLSVKNFGNDKDSLHNLHFEFLIEGENGRTNSSCKKLLELFGFAQDDINYIININNFNNEHYLETCIHIVEKTIYNEKLKFKKSYNTLSFKDVT